MVHRVATWLVSLFSGGDRRAAATLPHGGGGQEGSGGGGCGGASCGPGSRGLGAPPHLTVAVRRGLTGLRAPRLKIQLTPLPRVTLEFDRRARGGAARGSRTGSSGSASGGGGALEDPLPSPTLRGGARPAGGGFSGGGGPGRDSGSSGACSSSASSSCGGSVCDGAPAVASKPARTAVAPGLVADGRPLPGVAAARAEATASLGAVCTLPPGARGAALAAAVTDAHLLQFGAMLGERSCCDALAALGAPGPVGDHPDSLYGAAGTESFFGPWEEIADERTTGVLYRAWRRPLRGGLHLYLTRAVFLGALPAQLRAFAHDDAWRVAWDRSMASLGPAGAAGGKAGGGGRGCGKGRSGDDWHESDVLHALVRFPKPMAARSYTYARRVWPRPADGGCYVLSRACGAPGAGAPGAAGARAVAVTDYYSGAVVRAPGGALAAEAAAAAAAAGLGAAAPVAELLTVYFEDPRVRPSIVNMTIKKGLWPALLRTQRALRAHLDGSYRAEGAAAPGVGAAPGAAGAAGGGAASRVGAWAARAAGVLRGALGGAAAAAARTAAGALRAAAAAATALWAWQARLAALLPLIELRLLRSLSGLVVRGLASAPRGRAPLPPLSRPLSVDSFPLSCDAPRPARGVPLLPALAAPWRRARAAAAAYITSGAATAPEPGAPAGRAPRGAGGGSSSPRRRRGGLGARLVVALMQAAGLRAARKLLFPSGPR